MVAVAEKWQRPRAQGMARFSMAILLPLAILSFRMRRVAMHCCRYNVHLPAFTLSHDPSALPRCAKTLGNWLPPS